MNASLPGPKLSPASRRGSPGGRRFELGLLFCALLAVPLVPPTAWASAPTKPNIIVILTDDQGYADLSVQDQVSHIKTPHIDSLAKAGIRCTAGYVTAPQCSPSRAGLITGRHQQRFGLDTIPDCPLPLEEVTLAERLHPSRLRQRHGGQMAPRSESDVCPMDQGASAGESAIAAWSRADSREMAPRLFAFSAGVR